MNPWENYCFDVLDEPAQLVAEVAHRMRTGVLVLTETRVVYLRKEQGKTYIDCEFSRDAITSVRFTMQIGGRQLSIEHGREWFVVVGSKRELEFFVDRLRQSVETNAARTEAEDLVRIAATEEEQAKQYKAKIDVVVGESVLDVAPASSGFSAGVLALTDTRLIFLRKSGEDLYADREFDRTSVRDLNHAESLDAWSLRFNDGTDQIVFDLNSKGELRSFLEPLRARAATIAAMDLAIHPETVVESESKNSSGIDEKEGSTKPREGETLILNRWIQRIIGWSFLALIAFGIYFFATNSCDDQNEINDPCLSSHVAQEACADRLSRQLDAFDRSKASGHSNADAWATSEATR